jgi:hypothetical protein
LETQDVVSLRAIPQHLGYNLPLLIAP